MFHREAEILENLRIPGVAQFYEAIECLDDDPPCSYIIQEYIEGISLQQMIQIGHRFMVTEVYDILIQTLTILNRLQHHDPPIIYRDIKPSNLMISADSKGKFKVTLIDFGAVANPQIQGGGSTVAGTIGYMPPEQLRGITHPKVVFDVAIAFGRHVFAFFYSQCSMIQAFQQCAMRNAQCAINQAFSMRFIKNDVSLASESNFKHCHSIAHCALPIAH